MSTKTADGKFIVFGETWTESERGWGCRPDGHTLHLTKEDRDKFVKSFNAKLPAEVPYEYSRPDQNLKPTAVSEETYKEIKASDNGIWGQGNSFQAWEG
ncbi:hypothetical protein N9948_00015 [bacterium]|nr:hypothetical protein [bacterium]